MNSCRNDTSMHRQDSSPVLKLRCNWNTTLRPFWGRQILHMPGDHSGFSQGITLSDQATWAKWFEQKKIPWRILVCGFVFAMVLQHQFWGRVSHFLVRWRALGAAGCLCCFYTAAARIGFMSGSNEINLTVCFLRPSPLIKLAGYSRNM